MAWHSISVISVGQGKEVLRYPFGMYNQCLARYTFEAKDSNLPYDEAGFSGLGDSSSVMFWGSFHASATNLS